MSIAFTFPGQGSQSVGMGKDLAEAFPEARAVFAGGRRRARRKSLQDDLGRPRRRPDADGQRPAGADGGIAGGVARARSARLCAEGQGRLCRRPFARRIFRACRRRHLLASPTRRGCCAFAAMPCRWPCRPARAPWRRSSASTRPTSKRPAPRRPGARSARSPTTMAAASWSSPAPRRRSSTPPGLHREGRQARHHAAGLRTVPFGADAAGRRRDAGRVRHGRQIGTRRARRRQRRGRARSPIPRRSSPSWSTQVTGRVRWRETVEWFGANGVTTLYEIGAGKVLSGLARRINRDIAHGCGRQSGRRRGGARRARLIWQSTAHLDQGRVRDPLWRNRPCLI